tara:strand:- start:568 stop:1176 length:609 start_codon:yes stop_codon:yes gene_type:complete
VVAKAASKAKTKAKLKTKAKSKAVAKKKAKSKPAPKTKAKPKPKAKTKSRPKGASPGAKAPDFRLRDGNGKMHRLASYQGKKVILYFYPKDDTPGCTLEADEFNKENKKFEAKGAAVLGVSPDNEVSHKRFSENLDLRYSLLADPDGLVATQFGAYGEKTLYGMKFKSVFRTTFIIDEEGIIEKVFKKVQVEGHAKEVLKAL